MKRSLFYCQAVVAVCALTVVLASSSLVSAQQNAGQNKELPLKELLKLPGRLLGEATTAPTGQFKVTGYRVEEVRLPRNVTAEVRGQQIVTDRAWRVTITGGPFPVRALPAFIWIDDQIIGTGIENERLSQITAITFDNSLLREGGVVSLSYGEDKEDRITVSPRLQLRREGENQ